MREINLFRKMQKAFALAGDNPTTEEEVNAYKIAMDIKRKLERKKHRQPLQLGLGALVPYKPNIKPKSKTKWKEYLRIEKVPVITIQVIPDTSTRNYKTEDIARMIVQLFRLPIDRIKRDGMMFSYRIQEKVSFEIRMIKGEISFLFHIPKNLETVITKKIQTVWDKCTVVKLPEHEFNYTKENTVVQELVYRKHDIYSLNTDSKNNDPLNSIFESSSLLSEGEKASIFATFEPIHQATVQNELQEVWRKLRDGSPPRKFDFTFRNILFLTAIGVNELLREIVSTMGELFSNGKEENVHTKKYVANPEGMKMTIDNLSTATKQKSGKEILKTSLLIATSSHDEQKAKIINQSICNAWGDIAGDNDLQSKEIRGSKKEEVLKSINNRIGPKVHIRSNLMTVQEVGKIIQLAGDELINKYKDITSIKQRQFDVDKALRNAGIKLGEVTFRGQKIPVFIPCKNFDELCLPTVILGGMGQGKSFHIANRAIQYNLQGFGCIVVDPAKGEIGDIIERVLPPENIVRINLAKTPMSLEWCEVYHLEKFKTRLSNAIISFFNTHSDEAGVRTQRYLKAVVYAMQTGKLKEVLDILENKTYRKLLIDHMPDNFHKATLQEFDSLSPAMQQQIKMPIYNRLDVILSDEFLVECMDSEKQLNMVELMESNKCIILDVPKKVLGEEGVDLFCNMISSKIHIGMTSRDEKKSRPFFILFDELHQMQRSIEIWKAAAVESRKWRIGYNFILHGFDQVDRKLIQIIQDAGPSYVLFRSSQKTFKELEKTIAPFTVEDGMKLERYHAINIVNADNRVIEPFIAYMNNPL